MTIGGAFATFLLTLVGFAESEYYWDLEVGGVTQTAEPPTQGSRFNED